MPVSRRRVPKERPPQESSNRTKLMRRAMSKRMQAEREVLAEFAKTRLFDRRIEERLMLQVLKDVPSIFFFAEQEGKGYVRPQWASDRWGAR